MATGRPRDFVKERQWRRWLEEQQASGLSVRAFCRRRGLQEQAFYQWRRTLAARAPLSSSRPCQLFVPVAVVQPDVDSRIEIVLLGGRRLHVPASFDAAALARVVAVLEGQAC